MRIGGLQKVSLIDYPGKLAAVIFTQGCNLRCRYCHNAELVIPERFCLGIPEAEVLDFLKNRRQYLEGIVISGGEPTQQLDLISFLDKIKQMGYLVKLDTNGSHPQILKRIIDLKLANYIAMDVKAPLRKYKEVTATEVSIESIQESIEIIIHSGIHYEFRTTVVKSLCGQRDLEEISLLLKDASNHTLQNFRPSDKIVDKTLLKDSQYSDEEFIRLRSEFEKHMTQEFCFV